MYHLMNLHVQSNLFDMETKGIGPSVRFKEVSVL